MRKILNQNSRTLRVPKVLLIEDHLQTAEVMKTLMMMGGYAVHVEQQTTDVINLLEDYQPDLVIIDYILPFINGGELCSEIKQHADFGKLPVILCSAYPKVLLSLGQYRCDTFIAKPFDLTELLAAIEQVRCPRTMIPGLQHRIN